MSRCIERTLEYTGTHVMNRTRLFSLRPPAAFGKEINDYLKSQAEATGSTAAPEATGRTTFVIPGIPSLEQLNVTSDDEGLYEGGAPRRARYSSE